MRMTTTVSNKYEHTATGMLGEKRPSMLQNTIHQRAQLAKSRSYCHNIPDDMIMGIRTHRDATAVSKAFTWFDTKGNNATKNDGRRQTAAKSDLAKYQPSIQHLASTDKAGRIEAQRRPSTPIQDVISHRYQADWIREQARRSEAKSAASAARPSVLRPFETRASVLRTRAPHSSTPSRLPRQKRQ